MLRGFEGATSRQIASLAQVNVSLINRYFGSEEGLFEAVVDEAAASLIELEATSVAQLVDQLVDGLADDAWPDFGNEHPI